MTQRVCYVDVAAVSPTLAVLELGGQARRHCRRGGDWPQWRGPDRTGLSKESALLRQWPRSGPALLWSAANLGAGYGSLAVSGDRIFVQGTRAGRASW